MTYYQFIQAVELKLNEVINENISISVHIVKKNNGVKRYGIVIGQEDNNISPTIYLEEYYEKYLTGYSVENIVKNIWELYQEVRLQVSWDEDLITEFQEIRNKIVYRLVNFEANKELLKEVPFIPYLDLAIVFYVMMEINERGTACMMIRKEHLDMWGVSINEISERAQMNTWKLLPCEFRTMRAVMKEFQKTGNYVGMDILYVLTNKMRSFGAACILYEGCLEMIASFLNDNFYVLPSSVHEVIIVAESDAPWEGEGLADMVSEINQTQVDAEDILSDNAYYYDREKKKLL